MQLLGKPTFPFRPSADPSLFANVRERRSWQLHSTSLVGAIRQLLNRGAPNGLPLVHL